MLGLTVVIKHTITIYILFSQSLAHVVGQRSITL